MEKITLAGPSLLRVWVHDVSGRLVATLHDGDAPAGTVALDWSAPALLGVDPPLASPGLAALPASTRRALEQVRPDPPPPALTRPACRC